MKKEKYFPLLVERLILSYEKNNMFLSTKTETRRTRKSLFNRSYIVVRIKTIEIYYINAKRNIFFISY